MSEEYEEPEEYFGEDCTYRFSADLMGDVEITKHYGNGYSLMLTVPWVDLVMIMKKYSRGLGG